MIGHAHMNFSAICLQGKEGAKLRSIALLILNMIAQQRHELAHKYCASYLPILLEGCRDNNSEIKQEATRGIRICAELGTSNFKPFVNRILSDLSVLIKEQNRSISEDAKVYDIAVSCIGRIYEFHRDSIDGSKIVPAWLSCLPLKNDLTEAKLMHEQLCLMVGRKDKDLLLGASNQNFIKILVVFLEVIDTDDKLASSQTVRQINMLLRQLGRNIPRTAIDTVLSSLNDQQRELLLPFLAS
ncbi:hypothetical protein PIB30_004783 [Stylosanthes scabra]|uniref:Uncharacterized protein n=1 Tax=Stylosanthes scabra TaxID=79078 RepID=A0ABU6T3K0_9FABA|nr:hypothetical protein [Stylosanthes scabra]